MKFLCVGQDVLLVDPCESRCRHEHSNSQSGSQSACGEGQPRAGGEGGSGGAEQRAGQERGAILKGYPLSATLAKGITPCCRLFSISG